MTVNNMILLLMAEKMRVMIGELPAEQKTRVEAGSDGKPRKLRLDGTPVDPSDTPIIKRKDYISDGKGGFVEVLPGLHQGGSWKKPIPAEK